MYHICHIGCVIRKYRQQKNLTIEKTAELCDLSVRGYVKIELGYSDPKWSSISKIATVLEIDLGALLVCTNLLSNKHTE